MWRGERLDQIQQPYVRYRLRTDRAAHRRAHAKSGSIFVRKSTVCCSLTCAFECLQIVDRFSTAEVVQPVGVWLSRAKVSAPGSLRPVAHEKYQAAVGPGARLGVDIHVG